MHCICSLEIPATARQQLLMAMAIWFVIAARMDSIVDRFGITYTVTRTQLDGGTAVYHVHAGELLVARAVLHFFKGCIDDVLVYREAAGAGSPAPCTA